MEQHTRNWHRMTNAELEKVLHSDTATGLSEAEAARRLRRKKNTVWRLKGTSVKKYAAKSFMEFTTVLLIAAVITGAVFDGALGAVLVCVMLFACRAARIGAYIWAQRKLEKNAAEALPRARVVRGGSVRSIPADMIAPGDVIILDTGDTVPCDIRLTAADNLLVSEGTVTDNDGIVSKNSEPVAIGGEVPVTMRSNMLYATSAVISGFAVGIAVATGRDTLVCAREGEVVLSGGDDVPVLAKLADWSRICSLSLTAASLVITAAGVAVGHKTLAEAFVPAVAMAAACLSEYLGAVGAAAWAAALRPDSDGAVMRSAAAAECAANADILVLRSPAVMKSGKNTLHSYYKDSKLTMIGTKGAGIPYRLLSLACYCTGMSPRGSIAKGSFGKKTRHTGVLAYSVVRALWDENGDAKYDPNYTVVSHVAAGEENSGGLDNVLLARANDMFFAASGSVAKILPLCKTQRIGNEIVPLDADARRRISEFAAGLMQRGVTVCAVGFRRSHYNNLRRMSVLQSDLCFEGFFAVSQRLGEGALERLSDFRKSGGRVVLFSNADAAEEELYFCRAEGIYSVNDTYIGFDDSKKTNVLPLEAGSLTVVCTGGGADGIRERLRYVKMCSEAGNCAYIGFGVEDMWSMQAADVSFAVLSPGSDGVPQALRQAADGIVSSQDGFAACMRLTDKCRLALVNIRHILKYLIVSHAARLIIMLLTALTGMMLLSPPQLVFWGVVVDLLAALAIAFVPYDRTRKGGREYVGTVGAVPDTAAEVLLPTLYGALTAALSFAVPFISRLICSAASVPLEMSSGGMLSCIYISCILAMPVAAAEFAGGNGLFGKNSTYGKAFIAPFAAVVTGAAAALTPLSASASGTAFPGWISLAVCFLPVLVLIGVMSVARALKNRSISQKSGSIL